MIVNEAFEKHHFPGESAVGKRIRLRARGAEARWQTVVGVVSDVRQSGLAGDVMLEVYSPVLEDMGGALSFVIRATGEPASLISAVRASGGGGGTEPGAPQRDDDGATAGEHHDLAATEHGLAGQLCGEWRCCSPSWASTA